MVPGPSEHHYSETAQNQPKRRQPRPQVRLKSFLQGLSILKSMKIMTNKVLKLHSGPYEKE